MAILDLVLSDACSVNRKGWHDVQALAIGIGIPIIVGSPIERASTKATNLYFAIPVCAINAIGKIIFKNKTELFFFRETR